MVDRGAAGRRAASPAAEEAPKKQKVGDTGHVRNANDVHTNGHVKNICLPTDYELNATISCTTRGGKSTVWTPHQSQI